MDKLLTAAEVAEVLQVSPETVKALLRDGSLRGIKVSNKWRVSVKDLETYLNRGGNR